MKEYRFVDQQYKNKCWKDGPWMQEPDKVHWIDEETGLHCIIRRNEEMGFLCGYVAINKGHPLFEIGYNQANEKIDVYGDLTYANYCMEDAPKDRAICHDVEPGLEAWWFGFDTAHAGDLMPYIGMAGNGHLDDFGIGGNTYKDIAFLKKECEKLAKQLKELAC